MDYYNVVVTDGTTITIGMNDIYLEAQPSSGVYVVRNKYTDRTWSVSQEEHEVLMTRLKARNNIKHAKEP
jgi:hypothetical protein